MRGNALFHKVLRVLTKYFLELFNHTGENNNPVALWILAHFFANISEPGLLCAKMYLEKMEGLAEKQVGDVSKRDASSNNNFRGDIFEGYSESFGFGYNPHLYKEDRDGIIQDGMLGSIDMLALRKKVYFLTASDYYKPGHMIIKPSLKMKEFGKYAVIIGDVEECPPRHSRNIETGEQTRALGEIFKIFLKIVPLSFRFNGFDSKNSKLRFLEQGC